MVFFKIYSHTLLGIALRYVLAAFSLLACLSASMGPIAFPGVSDVPFSLLFVLKRRAALTRVRNRKRRSNIKRRAIPGLVLLFLLFSLVYTIYDLKRLLLEYGFVESCETMACRLAEFQLWQKLNSNPVDIKEYCTTSQICTVQDDSAFYAMHTIASTEWIPLDET